MHWRVKQTMRTLLLFMKMRIKPLDLGLMVIRSVGGYNYATRMLVQIILKPTHPDYTTNFTTINPNTKGLQYGC